ncbi:MAG: hypothetical protein KEFWMYNX_002455 [Candidatus Fervidibacter sp.]|jgi:hypothetical protein
MTLCLIGAMVAAQSEKRVTIELKDAPITEAFDRLFKAVGENFVLMPGTPTEQRLTLRLVDVPFEKALSFLCDVAGLKWERKDGTYLISPIPRPLVPPRVGAMGGVVLPGVPVLSKEAMEKLLEFRFWDEFLARELLSRFAFPPEIGLGGIRCPKCRHFIRLQCPQCKRSVSPNWQFCPYDGTKLPPAPEKCPKCGAPLPKPK